jgi:hypothetical protein
MPNSVIGDTNCQPLSVNRDTRRDMITNYLSSHWSMVYMDQGPDTLKWDHSYVSKGTGATCEIERDLFVATDHKHGLSVTIPVKNNLTYDIY